MKNPYTTDTVINEMRKEVKIYLRQIKDIAERINAESVPKSELSGTCPTGMVNDPTPGLCGQYIDKDSDSICDRSQ